MRYTPLSVSEQCEIETEMLEHFGYRGETSAYSLTKDGTIRTVKIKKTLNKRKAADALTISQMFFSLAETTDAPIDCEEMTLAIRYKLGYGWWAWFFFKNFAIPIIKYLWKRYHESDPTDFGAYLERVVAADPELAKRVAEAEKELDCGCRMTPGYNCPIHDGP